MTNCLKNVINLLLVSLLALLLNTEALLFGIDNTLMLSKQMRSSSSSLQMNSLTQEELKKMVGYKAVDDYVKSGMVVGLGTGSTAYYATERVGLKLKSGELTNVIGIPTSERTKQQALDLGIPLDVLDNQPHLDVAIDGADSVDPTLCLIKGGGGTLLRDKIVECFAKRFICIVDESKLVKGLGPAFPLPVEITSFCHEHTIRLLEQLPSIRGCKAVLRRGSVSNNLPDGPEIAITDNGNYLVDLFFNQPIADAAITAAELKATVGVLDHGIFANVASTVIVAGANGVRVAGEGGEKPWW